MKRLHVHVKVDDLSQSMRFYSTLFAAEPTVVKPDYAKWMLDDPRVNFAISTSGGDHTGNVDVGDRVAEPRAYVGRGSRAHRLSVWRFGGV